MFVILSHVFNKNLNINQTKKNRSGGKERKIRLCRISMCWHKIWNNPGLLHLCVQSFLSNVNYWISSSACPWKGATVSHTYQDSRLHIGMFWSGIQVPTMLQQKVYVCSLVTSITRDSQKWILVSLMSKGFCVFCSYAIVIADLCPKAAGLGIRPALQTDSLRRASGREKVNGMRPHLAESRRCPGLLASEITYLFLNLQFVNGAGF